MTEALNSGQLAAVTKVIAIREHIQAILEILDNIEDDEFSILANEPEGINDTLKQLGESAESFNYEIEGYLSWSPLLGNDED